MDFKKAKYFPYLYCILKEIHNLNSLKLSNTHSFLYLFYVKSISTLSLTVITVTYNVNSENFRIKLMQFTTDLQKHFTLITIITAWHIQLHLSAWDICTTEDVSQQDTLFYRCNIKNTRFQLILLLEWLRENPAVMWLDAVSNLIINPEKLQTLQPESTKINPSEVV